MSKKPRFNPYTNRGISRVPCCRCGNPSTQQWNICADNNIYRGICTICDIQLNAMVMIFMRVPERIKKITVYKKKMLKI